MVNHGLACDVTSAHNSWSKASCMGTSNSQGAGESPTLCRIVERIKLNSREGFRELLKAIPISGVMSIISTLGIKGFAPWLFRSLL